MFYEHVDTRISSLRYIKVKRFDNDIKKTLQKLKQIMKLSRYQNFQEQEKVCDHGCKGKAVMRRKPFPEINPLWPLTFNLLT